MLQHKRRQRRSIETDHGDSFSSSCSHAHTKTRGTWVGRRGTQKRRIKRWEKGGADKRFLIAPGRCRRHLQSRPRLRHTACSSPKQLPLPPGPICAPAKVAKQRGVKATIHMPLHSQIRMQRVCAMDYKQQIKRGRGVARHSLSEPAPQPLLRCISVCHCLPPWPRTSSTPQSCWVGGRVFCTQPPPSTFTLYEPFPNPPSTTLSLNSHNVRDPLTT